MTAANTIELNIDDKAIGYAKIYASLLTDEFQRKRAYASIAALYSLINLLEKTDNNVQKSMTLFRNPDLNEKYEINDVYVNNWHIDVRVVTDGTGFLVPRCHFDNDLEPDFYAVIKVDKELKTSELLGFADTALLTKEAYDYHYYSVDFNSLISFDKFIEKINNPKITNFAEQEHELFRDNYLSLIDGEIDEQLKNRLIKHLFECPECRTEFCCFTGFEMVSCNIGKYPDMIDDHTLKIVGAQAVDDEKYIGKEEVINISDDGDDNLPDEAPKQDETVSDLLDELFNDEEEPVQDNLSAEKDIELNPNLNSADLELLSDDGSEGLEMLDEYKEDKTENLEVIENENIDNLDNSNEDLVINSDDKEDDINITDNNDSNIEILSENNEQTDDNVQKVIMDYDENGEPVYSYITNIPPEDEKNADFDVELSDDDILNSTFETYPQYNEMDVDLSTIKNESSRIEYAQNDENESQSENVEPPVDDIDDVTAVDENIQTDENDNDETQSVENYSENYSETKEPVEMDSEETQEYNTESETEYSEEEDDGEEELPEDYEEYSADKPKSNNKLLPVLILVIALIGAGVGGFALLKNKSSNNVAQSDVQEETPIQEENNDMFEQPENAGMENPQNNPENINQNADNTAPAIDNNQQEMPSRGTIEVPQTPNQLTESDLLKNQRPATSDVNQAMTNAFAGSNNISVRGVNWLCSPQLFTNGEFKNYLQKLDNVLKLNLRKNILDVVETPQNNSVEVKLAVDNNGNLSRYMVSQSSGSQRIDDVVLQSIKETFEGEKSPILTNGDLKSDMYYLKVVIKL